MTREELLQTAKPILFNTDMVRAILDDRKTVTRRCVKPQPKSRLCYTFAGSDYGTWGYPAPSSYEIWGEEYRLSEDITKEDIKKRWKPPYHTDDILYVRETWCDDRQFTHDSTPGRYFYKASENGDFKWEPPIHMPKEAARIFLIVTDVRVERLQEMSDEDCEKEGLENFCKKCKSIFSECDTCMNDGAIKEDFKELWNSTIKKSDLDTYGWDANPWVWVIEFERIEV